MNSDIDPDLLDFVKALARATEARDFAALTNRKTQGHAHADLRPLLQRTAK